MKRISKKGLLKSLLAATGVTAVRWQLLRPGLYCLDFHRINDRAACAFDRDVISCTPAQLCTSLLAVRDRFEVVNLDRLRAVVEGRTKPGRRPLALITFDDGYADNYQFAFPILKELDLSACFFVPTAFVGSTQPPWWDEIAWILRHATCERLHLESAGTDYDLRPEVLARSITQVQIHARRICRDRPALIEELRAGCRPAGSLAAEAATLLMTWPQIKEMHHAGMDFGSHTHTHPVLSQLDGPGQREELATSKAILEAELGQPIEAVAYPVGGPFQFNQETCRIAGSVGYRLGFSLARKCAELPIADPLAIPRFSVGGATLKAQLCYRWYCE